MLPSSTVENYLKAIYQGQLVLSPDARLVSMGHVAASLGVTPGTATTMVKALAESGLAEYEPYSGVRLSAAGEKLAGLVLRRHRLVELFLVQVMGMSWAEVHDEAEQLEHVVSERLIERIDEMLGHPTHDPHGDPIPTPEGQLPLDQFESLLTCPIKIPLKVTRVADQDPAFLRFIENNHLKPGEPIEVEARDAAADSVRVGGRNRQSITIGARAASKLLVEVARLVILVAFMGLATTVPARGQSKPFEILDNSFLVEEAFNQEKGVVQNIFNWTRIEGGAWEGSFTQEWPAPAMRHQLSYSIPFLGGGGSATHVGGVLVNYRYQVMEEAAGQPALAPRLSLILPTGRSVDASDRPGVQVNIPFSKQLGDLYLHGNCGMTWMQGIPVGSTDGTNLTSPQIAASVIWRAAPMLNVMLETVVAFEDSVVADLRTQRDRVVTISPGFRGGWNLGEKQVIIGLAAPITTDRGDRSAAVLTYFSYELPFTSNR